MQNSSAKKLGRNLAAAAACLMVAPFSIFSTATGQDSSLPAGLISPTPPGELQQVLDQGAAFAKRYEDAVYDACEFENRLQYEGLKEELHGIAGMNSQYEAATRTARESLCDEIATIEKSPDARTENGRARLDQLYGEIELILLNSPLEPRFVVPKLVRFINASSVDKLPKAVYGARRLILQIPPDQAKDLKSAVPGTPYGFAVLALCRYQSERATDGLKSAADVPVKLEPMDVPRMNVPQYFPPAPRVEDWPRYLDRMAMTLSLNPVQRETARVILNDMTIRVADLRQRRAAEYENLKSIQDAVQREAMRRVLERDVDAAFDEFKQRLANLASYERMTAVVAPF